MAGRSSSTGPRRTSTIRAYVSLPFSGDTDLRYFMRVLGTRITAAGSANEVYFDLPQVPTGERHDIEFTLFRPFSGRVFYEDIRLFPGAVYDLGTIADVSQ